MRQSIEPISAEEVLTIVSAVTGNKADTLGAFIADIVAADRIASLINMRFKVDPLLTALTIKKEQQND